MIELLRGRPTERLVVTMPPRMKEAVILMANDGNQDACQFVRHLIALEAERRQGVVEELLAAQPRLQEVAAASPPAVRPSYSPTLPQDTVCRDCGCSIGDDAADFECPKAPSDEDDDHQWVYESDLIAAIESGNQAPPGWMKKPAGRVVP